MRTKIIHAGKILSLFIGSNIAALILSFYLLKRDIPPIGSFGNAFLLSFSYKYYPAGIFSSFFESRMDTFDTIEFFTILGIVLYVGLFIFGLLFRSKKAQRTWLLALVLIQIWNILGFVNSNLNPFKDSSNLPELFEADLAQRLQLTPTSSVEPLVLTFGEAEATLSQWMDGAVFEFAYSANDGDVFHGAFPAAGILTYLEKGADEKVNRIFIKYLYISSEDIENNPQLLPALVARRDTFIQKVITEFVSPEAYDWFLINNPDRPDQSNRSEYITAYGRVFITISQN